MSLLAGDYDSASGSEDEDPFLKTLPKEDGASESEDGEKKEEGKEGSDSDDSSGDDDSWDSDPEVVKRKKMMKSALAAFESVKEDDLVFKKAEAQRREM